MAKKGYKDLSEAPHGTVILVRAGVAQERLGNVYLPPELVLVKVADGPQVVYNPWPLFTVVGLRAQIVLDKDAPHERLGRITSESDNFDSLLACASGAAANAFKEYFGVA